jgi:hypothetical protein
MVEEAAAAATLAMPGASLVEVGAQKLVDAWLDEEDGDDEEEQEEVKPRLHGLALVQMSDNETEEEERYSDGGEDEPDTNTSKLPGVIALVRMSDTEDEAGASTDNTEGSADEYDWDLLRREWSKHKQQQSGTKVRPQQQLHRRQMHHQREAKQRQRQQQHPQQQQHQLLQRQRQQRQPRRRSRVQDRLKLDTLRVLDHHDCASNSDSSQSYHSSNEGSPRAAGYTYRADRSGSTAPPHSTRPPPLPADPDYTAL